VTESREVFAGMRPLAGDIMREAKPHLYCRQCGTLHRASRTTCPQKDARDRRPFTLARKHGQDGNRHDRAARGPGLELLAGRQGQLRRRPRDRRRNPGRLSRSGDDRPSVEGLSDRAVSYLAAEAGIRQFLDIGTGLPTVNNTHEVAQRLAPESRIVYVDNDPLVLAHARALLTSTPEGACDYIDADLRDPDKIIAEAARTLDFAEPIAVMLLGILGYVPDKDEPGSIAAGLMNRVSPGSYLVINDGTNVFHGKPEDDAIGDSPRARIVALYAATGAVPYHLRTPEQIEDFFSGLELIDPGVVPVSRWRPEVTPPPAGVDSFCGVGRKP
jgi:O-methyltransferase involved in polyketide biosynthesis